MMPFVAVVVPFEQHFFAAHHVLADHVHDGDLFLFPFLDEGIHVLLEFLQGLGQDGIEGDHRVGAVGVRTHGAELEFITGEGKGRGPVPVRVVQQQFGNAAVQVQLQDRLVLLVEFIAYSFFHVSKDFTQVFADEDGNNGRGGFVGAETEIIAGRRDGSTENIGIVMNRLDGVDEESQEHQVGLRRLAGSQEVDPGVGGHAPVIMLATAIDAGEGLLMEQHAQFMAARYTVHYIHEQDIMVDGHAYFLEDGGALELCGGYFIMAGTQGNAQLVGFALVIAHEGIDPFGDAAEIMVFQLLAFGRGMTEYGTAAHHQVGAGIEQTLVHHEIFLFPAQGSRYFRNILVEIMAYLHGRLVQAGQGLQQGRLIVERFARIGYEDRWYAERFAGPDLHDEGRGGRIPGGVAPGLESRPEASARKRGSIGLLLDQRGTVEFFDGRTVALYSKEGIVFFSSRTGEGLEPVCEVRDAFIFSPLAQTSSNLVGHSAIDLLTTFDRRNQTLVRFIA